MRNQQIAGNSHQVPTSETFFVKDNEESEATVPIQLAATAEYLKDYMALKEIWEALDGPNWKYYGEAAPMGCNWNFDKEIDMWGDQPAYSCWTTAGWHRS